VLKKHILNIGIGLRSGAAASLFDYRMLRAYAPVVYLLSIGGLVAVLSPLGSTINGSHSWILLPGGFSVQPSEFAKVALVVGMAMLLAEKRDAEEDPRDIDVVLALAFAAVPLALVMLPARPRDRSGRQRPRARGGGGVRRADPLGRRARRGAVLLAFVSIQVGVLQGLPARRLTGFIDPTADPKGTGYNVRQATIAIGSGGVHGQGLFHGAQTQGKFVPAQQTDFIFTVAGEELGFVGAAGIVALLGILLWRASRSRSGPTISSAGWSRPASCAGSPFRRSRTSA
jgi:rod shape determining protein RodA